MDTDPRPVIGLVGSEGSYGRWLRGFFEQRMGLRVLGHDPARADSASPDTLLQQCQILLFCAPIRHTPAIVTDYVKRAGGCERGQLWLDITSIKQAPVEAMLTSGAEVVGLHPMTAAPKSPTLKGRVMVVCEARLQHWRPWFTQFLAATQAQCVHSTPQQHDRIMALVQALVHATHLAQAGVLRDYAAAVGGLDALLPFRSASFELDGAIIARILALNPTIYEDIQFSNPNVPPMLAALKAQIDHLHTLVSRGDDTARAEFGRHFLEASRAALGTETIAQGNYSFERIGYLLADLAGERSISVYLPEDRSGSLRRLLHVFERHAINLASIHSSRTVAGELHFRIGLAPDTCNAALQRACQAIADEGIGRVLEPDATAAR